MFMYLYMCICPTDLVFSFNFRFSVFSFQLSIFNFSSFICISTLKDHTSLKPRKCQYKRNKTTPPCCQSRTPSPALVKRLCSCSCSCSLS